MNAFGGSQINEGFLKAFEVLDNSERRGKTTGCQRIVLYMTDGLNTGPPVDIRTINTRPGKNAKGFLGTKDRVKAHLITYHFGKETDIQGKKALQQIACENDGVSYQVKPGGNLKLAMASYFNFLAAGRDGVRKEGGTVVRWAETYEDGQGLGEGRHACALIRRLVSTRLLD